MNLKGMILGAIAASLLLAGCNGTSSDSDSKYGLGLTLIKEFDNAKYTCPTQVDFNNCMFGDCTSCESEVLVETPAPGYVCLTDEAIKSCMGGDCTPCEEIVEPVETCEIHLGTVTGRDGEVCQDEENILSCQDDMANLNGYLNAAVIQYGGVIYNCPVK